jgi:hypothetical protein
VTLGAAAPLRAPPPMVGRAVELLRGALLDDRLVELGWDEDRLVLEPVPEHPSFGFRVCEVQDCSAPRTRRGNVCSTCLQRFERSVAAGRCGDLEVFKRIGRRPSRKPERMCAVCCVEPGHVRPVAGSGLCGTHDSLRKRAGLPFDQFVALDSVVPLATFGVCRRRGCERVAAGSRRLCKACEKQWTKCGPPGPQRVLRRPLHRREASEGRTDLSRRAARAGPVRAVVRRAAVLRAATQRGLARGGVAWSATPALPGSSRCLSLTAAR